MPVSDYTITDSLFKLCITKHWFNAGTNTQYERMFELAKNFVREYIAAKADCDSVQRLTDIIWLCSSDEENGGDIPMQEVKQGLTEWFHSFDCYFE